MNRLLAGALAGVAAWRIGRAMARQNRRIDFHGKTVLITGGSRGLGLVLARQFGEEGARLVLCARDEAELERAREELADRGFPVLVMPCDLTDREQIARMVRQVHAAWGDVDVLVNNAGVIQVGPMEEMTENDYRQAMGVHFWGPLHAMYSVLPGMRRRGGGRVVNIASIGGKISVPHLMPYCASKFALVGLSQGFRAELRRHGVYVTTVCPGLMRTGSPVNAQFKGQNRREFAWFSVSDSLPLLSLDAERAARRIVEACRYGDAELITPLWAAGAATFHGLMPGLTADLMAVANRLLPRPGGIGTAIAKGSESRPRWLPSWLTASGDRAARRNNEYAT